jgi:O-antigen/teichoic acid export membrane protein
MFADYLGSFELVTWNLVALYPLAVNIILSNYLIVNHQERGYMKVCFIALLVNIIANTLLIPLWSVQGAVVARILTELFLCLSLVGFIYIFWRKQRINDASL